MPSQAASRPSAKPAARKRCSFAGCRKLAAPGRKRCPDHKPGAPQNPAKRGPGRKKLLGRAEPRLWTRPRRPLTRHTSRGFEVIDFAKLIGEPLLPWQEFAAIHALELNPDGTYRFRTVLVIVARQNGKSHLLRVLTLWRMYMDGARRILGVAQDVALARDQWKMCQDAIHACPDLEAEWGSVRNVNGDEMFWAGTARYAIKAANGRAGRGGSNEMVLIDELREQHDDKGWAAVSKTTMARRNGQVWAASNAGSDESTVLNDLRDAALAGNDPSLCLLEWSAEDGCELSDPKGWAQANPGLGHIIDEAAIRSAMNTDRPATFRTEVLCQRVSQLDGAIDADRWDASADLAGTLEQHKGNVAACLDVAPDGKHVTLAVAAPVGDGRARVEIAAAWKNTDEARRELPGLLARIKPQAFGWFPGGPAAGMATTVRPLALKYNKRHVKRQPGDPPEDGAITGARACEVCQELADLVKALRVVHPADPLLDVHVKGASKLQTGDGWRFTRKGEGHVDAAYAAAGAVSLALALPPVRRGRIYSFAA